MFEFVRSRITSADLIRLGSSLVLAILLWGWVTTREDPQTTQSFPNVPIQVGELPNGLVLVGSPPNALIRLKGPRSVINRISAADVSARLDLDEVKSPGTYTVPVVVSAPDGVWERNAFPSQVAIEVQAQAVKQFRLEPEVQGNVGASQRVGPITPDPSDVTVRGPDSVVAGVARVVLPVDIDDRTDDFVGTFSPVAEDANGQPVTEVDISPNAITTTVKIEAAGKSVAVFAQVVGAPAQGLDVLDSTVNPSTVLVDGPQDLLDKLPVAVQTQPIDITGATESVSRSVGLEGLPEGVQVVQPSDGQVEVFVQIGRRGVRQELPGLRVATTNLGSGLEAKVSPNDVTVVVVAAADILSRLTADDVTVQVDLSGLGPGVYTLKPTVSLPPNVQWISTDPTVVEVTIGPTSTTPLAGSPIASPVPTP
jgi:YbbR domain-containing protein